MGNPDLDLNIQIFGFPIERKIRNGIRDEFYRKIHCLTSEFHVKFNAKNRYRTNREAMSAISVLQVKFNVEFTSQAVNFS